MRAAYAPQDRANANTWQPANHVEREVVRRLRVESRENDPEK